MQEKTAASEQWANQLADRDSFPGCHTANNGGGRVAFVEVILTVSQRGPGKRSDGSDGLQEQSQGARYRTPPDLLPHDTMAYPCSSNRVDSVLNRMTPHLSILRQKRLH